MKRMTCSLKEHISTTEDMVMVYILLKIRINIKAILKGESLTVKELFIISH
jgi:hypothetical protein